MINIGSKVRWTNKDGEKFNAVVTGLFYDTPKQTMFYDVELSIPYKSRTKWLLPENELKLVFNF